MLLLCLSLQFLLVSADYHIGIVVRNITFQPPMNILSDGSCCNSTCGMNQTCCASTSCSPTLRLCFRESGHPMEDRSRCPLLEINRNNGNQTLVVFGTDNFPVQRYYTGGFQMYMRVSHFPGEAGSPDFSPPFTDPLIDEAFTEFSLPATLFPDRFMPQSQILDAVGEFGRVVLQVQANVHCAQNWNGSSCETLCTTSNGIATCTQEYDGPFIEPTELTTTVVPPTTLPTASLTTLPTASLTTASPTTPPTASLTTLPTATMATSASSTDANSAANSTEDTRTDSNIEIAVGVPLGVGLTLLASIVIILLAGWWKSRKTDDPGFIFVDDKSDLHYGKSDATLEARTAVISYMAERLRESDSKRDSVLNL